jgi:hypothetical protein
MLILIHCIDLECLEMFLFDIWNALVQFSFSIWLYDLPSLRISTMFYPTILLILNEELLYLFGVVLFIYDSDYSTEPTSGKIVSESTSSIILKLFSFNTSMISLNEGRTFGLIASPDRISWETNFGMNLGIVSLTMSVLFTQLFRSPAYSNEWWPTMSENRINANEKISVFWISLWPDRTLSVTSSNSTLFAFRRFSSKFARLCNSAWFGTIFIIWIWWDSLKEYYSVSNSFRSIRNCI